MQKPRGRFQGSMKLIAHSDAGTRGGGGAGRAKVPFGL